MAKKTTKPLRRRDVRTRAERLAATPGRPVKDAAGHFVAGYSGNPLGSTGLPRGRRKALAELDKMIGTTANLQTLRIALQQAFNNDPMGFFQHIIMPLLPRSATFQVDENAAGVFQLVITRAIPPADQTAIDAGFTEDTDLTKAGRSRAVRVNRAHDAVAVLREERAERAKAIDTAQAPDVKE